MVDIGQSLISVIIPAHNEEKYINQTIQSVLNQTYPSVEIIAVPNGCTDNTHSVIQTIMDKSPASTRILSINQKQAHVSLARNKGADIAKGEILVFLDADTVLEPNSLSLIAQKFTQDHSSATLKIAPDQFQLSYAMYCGIKNNINKLHFYKGISGVFICHKKHFTQVGGFNKNLQLKEHKDLRKRLDNLGKYTYINAIATTSMRRHKAKGLLKNVGFWIKTVLKDIETYEVIR
jgi:glycosyltransferase involved in cell wall biosynthesis